MAFDCLDKKLSKEPNMKIDDITLYLARFSRSKRRCYVDPGLSDVWGLSNIKDLLKGADAINCGTDIRHFEDFLKEDLASPLVNQVNDVYGNTLFNQGVMEFHYEFIFHEVQDYPEISGTSTIPYVIGCSFHPRGLFKA
jgi:hypothetical protein